jgi:hypothetical protein
MIDDHDLRDRFLERDAALPAPDDRLFARILAHLDAQPKPRFSWPSFTWPMSLVAATAIVIVVGVLANPWPQRPAFEPGSVEDVKIDRVPTQPASQTVPLAVSKAIKIDASSTMRNPASVEAPAPETSPNPLDAGLARTGSIDVFVAGVVPALRAAQQIATAHGGTVTALQDATPDTPDTPQSATLTVVVPADRLAATMDALAALGTIRAQSAGAEAVGGAIVDDAARLRNLRSEENDLLAIMHRSGSVGDILDVESKLADVRGQIEQLDGDLAGLKHRVATASIDVTLTERRAAAVPAVPSPGDRLASAWSNATHASAAFGVALLSVALGALAFAPYLLGAAAIAGAVVWWRRRRDG